MSKRRFFLPNSLSILMFFSILNTGPIVCLSQAIP